jgi:hypothetical protein
MEMIRNNHIALSVRKSFTSGPADVLLKKNGHIEKLNTEIYW